MKIGAREIGNGNPCYIIAEAGTAYAGALVEERFRKAASLINAAKRAGADAVKFQLFVPDEPLFCPLPGDERRWERWSQTFMTRELWEALLKPYDGMEVLASAFQPTAVQWLRELNAAAYKVASRAAATYPYDAVPGPFIISNGMGWPGHLSFGGHDLIRLECVSRYPTPLAKAAWTGCGCDECTRYDDGLSDHSGTIWPGLDAMARGCPMLEVHFAIDKADAGNDAPVCLSVDQLKTLCEFRDALALMRSR